MKSQSRFPCRSLQVACSAFFLIGLIRAAFGADALEQMRAISKLPELDLRKLEQGAIVANRGPLGNFTHGVYAENCYFIHAPVATVGEKLLHWNSAKHPELEIAMLREYRWPAAANVWDPLALTSARREDRWLTERTLQLLLTSGFTTDLHVHRADIASFREIMRQSGKGLPAQQRDAKVNAFWRKLLHARNDALASGGLAALPNYFANGVRVDTRAVLDNLLKLAPSIAGHFAALLNGAPFNATPDSSLEIVPYWEAALVRGHTNLHCGFLVARQGAQSWQIADCTYYTSDTYFMSVTLYELWLQQNGTLIWQTDFASAPFRSFTGGLDRVFAGNEMIKEAAQSAKLFRADAEQHR